MNRPSPFWIRVAALIFSVKTFAAAMLALVTALLLDMPHPYCAILSQGYGRINGDWRHEI